MARRLSPAITLASLGLLSGCASSSLDSRDVAANVEQVANESLRDRGLVGLSIAIAREGKIVLEEGYGYERFDPPVSMTPSSVHDYYSAAKHVTAALLLRLEEQGRIDLGDLVTNHLPDADLEGAPVTIEQLLRHLSGLHDAPFDERKPPPWAHRPPEAGERLRWPNESSRIAPPGATWIYSSAGYVFADLVLEAVGDAPFDTLLADEARAPLGLSAFHSCRLVARVQEYVVEGTEREEIPRVDPGWYPAPVCGTAGDLVRWWIGLRGGDVVGRESLARMFAPSRIGDAGARVEFGYGMGVRLGTFHGHAKLGHAGTGGGGSSVIAEYPEDDLVIAVLTNSAGPEIPYALDIEAAIALRLVVGGTPIYAELPLSSRLLDAAPGYYVSAGEGIETTFCITRKGNHLVRSIDGGPAERMRHVGAGRFRDSNDAFGEESFLGTDHGEARWFAFDWHGLPSDLATRKGTSCPSDSLQFQPERARLPL